MNAAHVWCNNCPQLERNPNCKSCDRLWEKYPYESLEEMQLLAEKHFPDVIQKTPIKINEN